MHLFNPDNLWLKAPHQQRDQSNLNFLEVAILEALEENRLELLKQVGPDKIPALLWACENKDQVIARRAGEVLTQLTMRASRDALCRLVLVGGGHPLAQEIAVRADYRPSEAQDHALFFFLTGQWERYEKLDFDYRIFKRAYELADDKMRRRLAELARQAGYGKLIEIIVNVHRGRYLTGSEIPEWRMILELLVKNQQWPKAWELAQIAPPMWSVTILQQLPENGWQPETGEEQVVFQTLNQLAGKCGAVNRDTAGAWYAGLDKLVSLAVEHSSLSQLEWLQELQRNVVMSKDERAWVNFTETLLSWHWKRKIRDDHDVEIEDTLVSLSEFDIELA